MARIQKADLPATTAGAARVFRRNPFSHLSFGHVVMITAGLLAFLLNVFLIRNRAEMMEVPVASRTITAGSRLGTDDYSTKFVDANGPFADRVLSREGIKGLLGYVVVRNIAAGAPFIADDLRPAASPEGGRAMSIPISPDHAVGAALTVGDRVDVIAVEGGESRFIATGIEVLDVSSGGSRISGDRFGVTVAVSEVEALAIAGALDRSAVHLIRSTGAEPISGASLPPLPVVRKGESEL